MPTLAIIIPAFNEEDRLGKTLDSIARAWKDSLIPELTLSQVIIADDGSKDRTIAVAEEWKKVLPIEIVALPKNRGKGAAVRTGMQASRADLALIYDADGAAPIVEINKLYKEMKMKDADIAIGSRALERRQSLVTMSWHRRIIGRIYHAICYALVPGLHDTACGCKLFTAEAVKELFALQRIDRFAFDVEILAIALRRGYKVVEVPLMWTAIPESKVRIIRDGIQMFSCVLPLYLRADTSPLFPRSAELKEASA